MKNNMTELVFILDRSGSMAGLESDTVGGFNAMIQKQKKQEGECLVSTVLFDHQSRVIHDRILLADVPPMTEEDYAVGGCTALLDAVGSAIKHIGNIHKYAGKQDVPAHTLFVIMTDGQENASRCYDAAQIREMIGRQKEKYGWEFMFIGANIDAVETARVYGIGRERAVNYHADSKGTRVVYDAVSSLVDTVRADEPIGEQWSKNIDEDYRSRSKTI